MSTTIHATGAISTAANVIAPSTMRCGSARNRRKKTVARLRARWSLTCSHTRGVLPQLGRTPLGRESRGDGAGELVDGDPVLRERVAIADRHRAVLERLVVDRHAPRR